jgi:hypothetical protein
MLCRGETVNDFHLCRIGKSQKRLEAGRQVKDYQRFVKGETGKTCMKDIQ